MNQAIGLGRSTIHNAVVLVLSILAEATGVVLSGRDGASCVGIGILDGVVSAGLGLVDNAMGFFIRSRNGVVRPGFSIVDNLIPLVQDILRVIELSRESIPQLIEQLENTLTRNHTIGRQWHAVCLF